MQAGRRMRTGPPALNVGFYGNSSCCIHSLVWLTDNDNKRQDRERNPPAECGETASQDATVCWNPNPDVLNNHITGSLYLSFKTALMKPLKPPGSRVHGEPGTGKDLPRLFSESCLAVSV